MATAIQFRRGTTAQHANFTGLVGEVTVDTDLDTIRVHDGSTAGGSRLAKYSEIAALGTGDITAIVAGNGLTGGAASGNATVDVGAGNGITVNADDIAVNVAYFDQTAGGTGWGANLEPSANNTYSLGSASNVWKDVYIGPGSLYVNGQQVLSDSSGTITVSADTGQNIAVTTTGGGDVELTAGGDIQLKSNIIVTSGKVLSSSGGVKFASNLNLDSNSINNLDNPVAAQDAATKDYVDNLTYLTGGTGITLSGGTLSTTDAQIVHDSLSGFVANEHIDHTSVSITAGSGLTGGGNIAASMTINVGAGNGITVNNDDIEINEAYYDTEEGGTGWTGNLNPSSNNVYSLGSATSVWKDVHVGPNSLKIAGVALGTSGGQLQFGSANVFVQGNADAEDDVKALFSATDAGGDGSFSYSDGVFTYTGPSQAEANIRIQAHVSGGTGIAFSAGGVITTTDSEIVHDSLSGFVSNEHIDHSAVSITAGSYLTGGGDITTTRTLNVDATTTATASKVVARDASGDVYANLFQGTATSARYADLAEKYATDKEYEPGTVVCFGGDAEVTECIHDSNYAVAGVISTDPAYMMNSGANGQYVALTGRVPCKVTGIVNKGDLLVTSTVPGHAQTNNNGQTGRVLGKAIGENLEDTDAVIEVLVNLM